MPAVPKVPLLADDFVTLFTSPDPKNVYAYTPGIIRLSSGRLIATMDVGGPGVKDLPGPKGLRGEGPHPWQGIIFISDDGGETWREVGRFPFFHARPFVAGDSIYILGHAGDLRIIRSNDQGESWSASTNLTEDEWWHQSACSVVYANDRVYLVMEKLVGPPNSWKQATLAPVVMSAPVNADLTRRESWTLSPPRMWIDLIGGAPAMVGIPFKQGTAGWFEANLVAIHDPNHPWYDPEGSTFYLWMRAANVPPNLACIAKVTEDGGRLALDTAKAPSGRTIAYLPCPGGHMKFYILYDEPSSLYWLVSSHSTDSLSGPYERHRLALHYSTNLFDWQMAGLVAVGKSKEQARHYASAVVDGDDLLVLSRSGTAAAKSAHDGDIISLHRVKRFRKLVY